MTHEEEMKRAFFGRGAEHDVNPSLLKVKVPVTASNKASESKFTPGPWVIERTDGGRVAYVSPSDQLENLGLFSVLPIDEKDDDSGDWFYGEQTEANAKLAAAAPDMYQALKVARRELYACQAAIHLRGGFDPAYVDDALRALQGMDAVIAKATA